MQVSYKWLKEYIDFPYNPEELAHVLTMAGMEVDEVEYLGAGIEEIIIGEILKIEKHPDADKLLICKVDTGDEVLDIVTGAANVFEGALVPVARIGVTLPDGLKIKKAKLRGVESYGMLCSTDELGLSEERASGIMILGDDAVKGSKLIEYLGLDDYIYKLDLTPNYGRCLGMLGVARELKAILGDREVKYPEFSIREGQEEISGLVEIEVVDTDLCPRYTGQIIKNVKIGPSPRWMQQRLTAAGIRPINNVVDITNYVMLEYNQPLHAFDFDKIAGKKVIVRRAKDGEKLLTLDDKERELTSEMLVIADSEKAIGLAGVMGGGNSEITEDTTTVFLEAAYFDPVSIRKTARGLGLISESSYRFERGIDLDKVLEAGRRAAYLMQEYAGGEVVKGVIDVYPEPYQPAKISLETSQVNTLLGITLSTQEIKDLLLGLDFGVEEESEERLIVSVPAFRTDVSRKADLIEEVARLYGYDNIPVSRPASKQQGQKTFKQKIMDLTRETMLASGLDEIITFSLCGEDDFEILNLPEDSELLKWVRVKNPLNEAYAILRTTLVPNLLQVLSNNARKQIDRIKIFELGNVFFHAEGAEPYIQYPRLAAASMGHQEDPWQLGAPDFFYLKGVLENYFERLGIKDYRFERKEIPYLHPGRTGAIFAGDKEIGFIGELLPDVIDNLDLKERTAIFQLDVDKLMQYIELERRYEELPRYPASERDLALLVDKDVAAVDLQRSIRDRGGKLLKNVEIFDLYQGERIPEDKKSLAFRLVFQAGDRTLTDEEVNEKIDGIIRELEEKFSAKIRGN